jgi:hypothetical protein
VSFRSLSLAAAFLFACAGSAGAQAVKIEFTGGRVTLMAQNAPARVVLAEWARLGGTKIVNGDQVTGAPMTLELVDIPERKALEILLRNVPGYIVSARQSPGVGGASAFDRVMILANTSAPRPPAAATFGSPAPRPSAFDAADDGPDMSAIRRANEQNLAVLQRAEEQNRAAQGGAVNGQTVVVTQPNGAVVIRGAPQPFLPDPTATPPAAQPAPGQAPRPASPFAPTPVPQQPQDARSPNTPQR